MKKMSILIMILALVIVTGCSKSNENNYHLTYEEMKKIIENTESIIVSNRYLDQETNKVLYNPTKTIVGETVDTMISILTNSSERQLEDMQLGFYHYPNKKIVLYDKDKNEIAIVDFDDSSNCNLIIKKKTFYLSINDYDLFSEIIND